MTADTESVIGAYVDGNSDFPANKITHAFYAFADTKDGVIDGVTDGDDTAERIRSVVAKKDANPDLSVSISVGGWGLCEDFPEMAATQQRRERFASNVVAFIREHDLDGLDFDWEFPDPEDRDNYTELVKTLRQFLDEAGAVDGKDYLLTAATSTVPSHLDGIDFDAVTQYYDFYNVMTYDMNHTAEQTHHTNLYTSEHNQRHSVRQTVENYRELGVPSEKLVIGAGYYSRGGVRLDYEELLPEYIENPEYENCWDVDAQAPYLQGPEGFIGYDDPRSVRRKVDYLRSADLRGIMFWHYNGDHEDALTDAIYRQMTETAAASADSE